MSLPTPTRRIGRRSGVVVASIAIWLSAAGLCMPARAAALQISSGIAGLPGVSPTLKVQSFQAQRFSAVIPQHFDYSCGSAALATLLTYSYDLPVRELPVFTSMVLHGNRALIQKYGFSLLDMKNYLQRHHLASAGFRAPIAKLEEVGVPAIVLINENGYRHFVVITGARDGRVLLADPAVGMRSERVSRFLHQWSGIFFLILNRPAVAKANFNLKRNWATSPLAPLSLSRFMVDFATLRQVGAGDPTLF